MIDRTISETDLYVRDTRPFKVFANINGVNDTLGIIPILELLHF